MSDQDSPADKPQQQDEPTLHQAFKPKGPGGEFTRSADGRIIPHRKSKFRQQKKGGLLAWLRGLFTRD